MDHVDRFVAMVRELPEVTIKGVQARLDRMGYWWAPWPVARKRVHIRGMLSKVRTADGFAMFMEIGRVPRTERRPGLGEQEVKELLEVLDGPEWRTLEEIRQRLLAAGWIRGGSEEQQIALLEEILGTEGTSPDPALCPAGEPPLVAWLWDNLDIPDPQPVYKLRDALTLEEGKRVVQHFVSMARQMNDELREARAFMRFRDKTGWPTKRTKPAPEPEEPETLTEREAKLRRLARGLAQEPLPPPPRTTSKEREKLLEIHRTVFGGKEGPEELAMAAMQAGVWSPEAVKTAGDYMLALKIHGMTEAIAEGQPTVGRRECEIREGLEKIILE